MDLEDNGSIPFLDVLISINQDGTLGNQVYKEKAHTESYLHSNYNHHSTQKMGFLNTLIVWNFRIFYKDHLRKDKDHLKKVF